MWKILFESESVSDIKNYIDNYLETLLDVYSDTGEWTESSIRTKTCIGQLKKLHLEIKNAIISKLSEDIGTFTPIEKDERSITLFLERRMIFVQYRESIADKTRYIESIRIVRR